MTCAGVVRAQLPAPVIQDPANPDQINVTDAQAQAALAGARRAGSVTSVRNAAWLLRASMGYAIAATPSLVWSGRVTGLPDYPQGAVGDTTGSVAPLVGGGWVGQIQTEHGQGTAVMIGGFGNFITDVGGGFGNFSTNVDPRDPRTVLAVRRYKSIVVDGVVNRGEPTPC